MKNINIELSIKSIDKAIAQIERYKKSLPNKSRVFLKKLANVGIETIEEKMSNVIGDSNTEHSVRATTKIDGKICSCKIVLRGEDIAFIEFGSGIVYNGNGSPHPKGEELGFTIGSYGYHQGKRGHWYYDDKNGQRTLSIGTKAAMPMYNAEMQMLEKIKEVAQEVYG
jgi:hypothetical protein